MMYISRKETEEGKGKTSLESRITKHTWILEEKKAASRWALELNDRWDSKCTADDPSRRGAI